VGSDLGNNTKEGGVSGHPAGKGPQRSEGRGSALEARSKGCEEEGEKSARARNAKTAKKPEGGANVLRFHGQLKYIALGSQAIKGQPLS